MDAEERYIREMERLQALYLAAGGKMMWHQYDEPNLDLEVWYKNAIEAAQKRYMNEREAEKEG